MLRLKRYVPWAIGALALAFCVYLWLGRPEGSLGDDPAEGRPGDELRISVPASEGLADLLYVAAGGGLFAREGLKVRFVKTGTSPKALQDAARGSVDAAVVGDVPLASLMFQEDRARVLAVVARARQDMVVIARRTAGVARAEDLKGKRIGVEEHASATYMLGVFLRRHGLSTSDVKPIEATGKSLPAGLAADEIDAIAEAFSERRDYIGEAKKLGEAAPPIVDAGFFTLRACLVASTDALAKRPDAYQKLMKALVAAEDLVRSRRADALAAAAKGRDEGRKKIDAEWKRLELGVSLDKALLDALEAQGAWYQGSRWNLRGSPKPSYKDLLHPDPLRAAKPDAVQL